jgi:hypothetical protein
MLVPATRLCNRCGRSLRGTEVLLGLCGFCLIDPAVPLPATMKPPTPQVETAPNSERPGTPYRHRPLRHCGCGAALKPRMRYCDQCRLRRLHETGRTRIMRWRQKRTEARPT